MNSPNQPNRNPIFEKLVLDHPDRTPERLIGMIAYAEYKQDKVDWIKAAPSASEEEVKAFLRIYNDRKLDECRAKAENHLLRYAGAYAKKELERILEEEKSKQLFQEIQRVKTSYWNAVGQGVLASLIFAIGVGLLSLIYSAARPSGGFAKVIEYLTSPDIASTTEPKPNTSEQKIPKSK
jgi:hypothetical protein